jgi:hypothetical protein
MAGENLDLSSRGGQMAKRLSRVERELTAAIDLAQRLLHR